MPTLFEVKDSQDRFNQSSFTFNHHLLDEPLLDIESLKKLVLRLPQNHVYASSSKVDIQANLDTAHKEHKINTSFEKALNELEHSDSFFMVRSPEIDSEYQTLFGRLKAEIESLARELNTEITDSTLYLFLTSPGGTTPYHLDRYSTFLMQLRGQKTVYTWAPWNKEMVKDELLEQYFAKKHETPPKLSPEHEPLGTGNVIEPGQGLHIPFLAPHWVKNGDEVSASVSIIFNTKNTRRKGLALCFNELMRRRFGLRLKGIEQKDSASETIKMQLYRGAMKAGIR